MKRILSIFLSLACTTSVQVSVSGGAEPIRHELSVRLSPDRHAISAEDSVTFPGMLLAPGESRARFFLHAGLSPEAITPGARVEREG
ncbi:MAG TPA: hypothetical protein VIS30_05975, partial [Candidatus Deferrimicrobiaceae bacterium]